MGDFPPMPRSMSVPPCEPAPLLELTVSDALATGNLRHVFHHPDNPTLLVKVVRADSIERRWGASASWYKRLPRARQYTGFVRELKEYIIAQARNPGRSVPLARMVGLVDTSLGLGLVSEKVRSPDGAMAPTLAARYEREGGFSDAIERDLALFLDQLLACNVIIGDLHAGNIAYGSDSRGGPRFVLIDGFGEKHALPFTSMSRRLNTHNTRKLYARMRERLQREVSLTGKG